MSTNSIRDYENYNATSLDYDKTRIPIGLEIILGHFASTARPLSEQRILDAGCGTGNYSHALLSRVEVGSVVGIDASEGMLAQARQKLGSWKHAATKHALLPELPFEEDSIDGIMVNQVIHHLDRTPKFPVLRRLLEEAWRVLRPGGTLVINTCSEEQLLKCHWYAEFFRPGAKRLAERYVPVVRLKDYLEEAGLNSVQMTVPLGELFYGDNYLDLDGPFSEQWRHGDSLFALLTQEELEQGLESLQREKESHFLTKRLADCEQRRLLMGQGTFVSARKSVF